MIERNLYLQELIKAKDNGFPKVIMGVRRCGKSYFLKDIYGKYLLEHGIKKDNILYIDLDDDGSVALRNPIALGEHVRALTKRKEERYYVFLDEIQKVYTIINPSLTNGKIVLAKSSNTEVVSFVDVVLGLSRKPNIDLYVTGSNSKMLSKDIVTEFRDKATNIGIAPLSYEEYYSYIGGSPTDALYTYMQYGGMPLAVLKDEVDKRKYLKDLFEVTYFHDILEHNKIEKTEALDELCNILSHSTGSLLSSEKIANTYKSKKKANIDSRVVEKYIGYFVDAFLLRETRRYDVRGRKEIGALKKYYFVDTGLRNARLNFAYQDDGEMLENVIYNELIYNGYTVNVVTFDTVEKDINGKSIRNTNEIDFYAVKNNRRYYLQVAENISDEATREREKRPFHFLRDNVQKVLIINKPINETRDENGLTIIGASDFMLRFIK